LGPLPFKYSPLWNENAAAKDLIQHTWQQHVEGSSGYIWERKIKNVKHALKDWVKTHYKEPENEKREAKAKLEELHSTMEKRGYQQADKNHEEKLYNQLYHIRREEEQKWRMKSRQLWLKGRDRNTTFFHKQTTIQKIRNNITYIIDSEGNQQIRQGAIKQAASDHYRELLTENGEEEDYTDLLQYLPNKIITEINDSLNKEIEEEEIRGAIWALQPDKAPGPDGFLICFYRAHWETIKKYLNKMMKWIQCRKKMGGYTNSTHLTLIP